MIRSTVQRAASWPWPRSQIHNLRDPSVWTNLPFLILGGDPAGSLEQDPELRIGVRRPHVRQDRALTSTFTHDLYRHRT
jgi:hypothetical protein